MQKHLSKSKVNVLVLALFCQTDFANPLVWNCTFQIESKMDDDAVLSADPTDVLLFMFFGLGVGILILQVLSHFGDPIPYTVVVFIFGCLVSLFNRDHDLGMWGDSIEKWTHIDAELMLYVFLPPLIFGEAMTLNWFSSWEGLLSPYCWRVQE